MPEGEEHNQTLGGLGMGALSDETVEIDEQGNFVKATDPEGNEESVESQESQDTQEKSQENEGEGSGSDLQTELSELFEGKEDQDQSQEKETEESSSDEESPDSSSPFYSLANALREEGALQSVDDEKLKNIDNAKDLVDLLSDEFEESKNSYLSNLEATAKEAAEAIEKGVPLEQFKEAKAEEQYYENTSKEDLQESEDLQKEILKQDYKRRGFSDERADKIIKNLEDTGELQDESETSLKELKESKKQETEQLKQQAEQERQEQEKQRKQELNKLHENIQSKNEIIPGLELKGKTKDKIYESMTTPVGQDGEGNPLDAVMQAWINDPDYPVKVHYLHQITNGFTDFSKLINTSKKKAVEDLNQAVNTGGNKAPGKPKETNKRNEKDWSSILSNS